MTLTQTLKPKASKSNSSKTPKFYNEEKNKCLADMAMHKNPQVRQAIASNSHTPTKILVGMLEGEQDKQVLRTVLFNSKLPKKAVSKFVSKENDKRVEWFEDDVELIAYFTEE